MGLSASLTQAPQAFFGFVLNLCTISIVTINNLTTKAVSALSRDFSKDPQPGIKLNVNGTDLEFLFDTGAMINCLSRDTFERHFKHLKSGISRPATAVAGAGNNRLQVDAIYRWPVTFRGQTRYHDFWVCNERQMDIVGVSLMRDF